MGKLRLRGVFLYWLAVFSLVVGVSSPYAQTVEQFSIQSYDVRGAGLLKEKEIASATQPYTGAARDFADVQRALEAIEALYKKKGFSAVQVQLPEQDITTGVVVIEVFETPVGVVTVSGNERVSTESIRRSLPALQEGRSPNARKISENVQLANENQSRQVAVVLSVGAAEDSVDARIDVKEDKVSRIFVTADNTGAEPTGQYRLGVGYQHSNVFGRDHTASAAYSTSPDKPSGVDIDVLSLGYRIPFYGIGDSLSLVYGYSNINTATTSALGSGLQINGKGDVFALRWNHFFSRRGEYSSNLVVGLDRKGVRSSCANSAGSVSGVAGCMDYTTLPLSLTYSGKRQGLVQLVEYALGVSHNIPVGEKVAASSGDVDRYSLASGDRRVKDGFNVIRLSGGYTRSWSDWLTRLALTGQAAPGSALVSSEQIGLSGAQAVRGFLDRVVVADSGVIVNLEAYSPDFAAKIGLTNSSLRGLVFYDYARGRDYDAAAGAPDKQLSSWGFGFRYAMGRDVTLGLDAARIGRVEPADIHRGTDPAGGVIDDNDRGDWRGHFALAVSF